MDSGFNVAMIIIVVALTLSIALAFVLTTLVIRKLRQVGAWLAQTPQEEAAASKTPTADNQPVGSKTGRNELWWLWPVFGFLAGCIAMLLNRQAQQSDRTDPELASERLLQAYNPLLMEVNALPLKTQPVDVEALMSLYKDQIRPLLYAQSHLLSQRVLKAATRLDESLSGDDISHMVDDLRALQSLIRADHERLSHQMSSHRTQSSSNGLSG